MGEPAYQLAPPGADIGRHFRTPVVRKHLGHLLADLRFRRRPEAAEELGRQAGPDNWRVIQLLTEIAWSSNNARSLRQACIRALGRIGGPHARREVLLMFGALTDTLKRDENIDDENHVELVYGERREPIGVQVAHDFKFPKRYRALLDLWRGNQVVYELLNALVDALDRLGDLDFLHLAIRTGFNNSYGVAAINRLIERDRIRAYPLLLYAFRSARKRAYIARYGKMLAEIYGWTSIAEFQRGAFDPSKFRREASLNNLASFGLGEDELLAKLQDSARGVRIVASEGLGRLATPGGMRALFDVLRNPNSQGKERQAADAAITRCITQAARDNDVDLLYEALEAGVDLGFGVRAARRLFTLKRDGLLGTLKSLAGRGQQPRYVRAITAVIARFSDAENEKVVAHLRKVIADKRDARRRAAAAIALGRLGQGESSLRDAMDDPAASVRVSAIRGLGKFGSRRSVAESTAAKLAARGCSTSSRRESEAACRSLGRCGARVVPLVLGSMLLSAGISPLRIFRILADIGSEVESFFFGRRRNPHFELSVPESERALRAFLRAERGGRKRLLEFCSRAVERLRDRAKHSTGTWKPPDSCERLLGEAEVSNSELSQIALALLAATL